MNNNDDCSGSPVSSEESTASPQSVTDEMIQTLNDEDEALIHARVETGFNRRTTIDDDETSIELGECQPSEVVNSPAENDNEFFEDQPIELEPHRAEPVAEIPYPTSPTIVNMIEDYELPLSPLIQNVTDHLNLPLYDMPELNERETTAEPIQNEDNEIETPYREVVPVQTTDNLTPPELLQETIPGILREHDVIDLTRDDDDDENEEIHQEQQLTAASPAVINHTEDEEIPHIQMNTSNADNDNSAQIQQTEDDPPVVLVSILERPPPVTSPSLEVADRTALIAHAADNADQTNATIIGLDSSPSTSQINKRSNSSDEIDHAAQNYTTGVTKRCRK